MPAVRTRLIGWTPPSGNEPDVEVTPPQRPFSNVLTTQPSQFHFTSTFSSTTSTDDVSRPSTAATPKEPASDTPASTVSANSTTRSGSPDHIRRPRNSFIIFRCQYSREHSKSQRQDGDETITAKSLSKRASEAWGRLSKEEKKVYEDMATLEKEEHARKNPDYRFKPKKRQPDAKRRKPFRIPSIVALRRRPASASSTSPSTSVSASVSSTPPQAQISQQSSPVTTLSPLLEAVPSLPLPPQPSPVPSLLPQLATVPKVDPAVKAARRRSVSAPQPYKPLAAPPMSHVYSVLERPEAPQRSRSIVARPVALPHHRINYTHVEHPPLGIIPRPIPPSFSTPELSVGYHGVAAFYDDSQSRLSSYGSSSERFTPPQGSPSFATPAYAPSGLRFVSPLAAVASTLSGWNSDFTATPSTTPQVPASPIDGSQLWQGAFAPPQPPGVAVQSQGDAVIPLDDTTKIAQNPYSSYSFEDGHISQPYADTASSPYTTILQTGPMAYQEADCSQALQEYDLGLSERLGSGSPLFFASSAELSGTDILFDKSFDFDLNALFPLPDSF